MSLIQQSCDNAAARIRFFRIAFGSGGDRQPVESAEAARTLADHYAGTRIAPEWRMSSDVARGTVQLAYLAALCLEAALPQGGNIALSIEENMLVAQAQGMTVRLDEDLWSMLQEGAPHAPRDLRPAHVQFALLAQLCADAGIVPDLRHAAQTAEVRLPLGQA
nr:histidine phosphotransferase family protein [Marivita sp. GX14005]